METISIPHSNSFGEIRIQKCTCGKKQKVILSSTGECVDIKTRK